MGTIVLYMFIILDTFIRMIPKKKLIIGLILLFVIGLSLFIWIRVQQSKVCGFQNCNGLDLSCGFNVPKICNSIYRIGDNCRQYASCQIVDGECNLVKDSKF